MLRLQSRAIESTSSPKRATASASTVMICGANVIASSAATSAASTAGSPCDNLTSWIAAAAARTRRHDVKGAIDFGIGNKRQNCIRVIASRELQRHRRRRSETERKRTPCRDDQPRHGWRA